MSFFVCPILRTNQSETTWVKVVVTTSQSSLIRVLHSSSPHLALGVVPKAQLVTARRPLSAVCELPLLGHPDRNFIRKKELSPPSSTLYLFIFFLILLSFWLRIVRIMDTESRLVIDSGWEEKWRVSA